ncbi:calcium-independent phospholipase A2-gamma [Eublepharis macularius]|uniref:Calcium-independent phospholipase A2-gamma n=1 Tax=Eublepharis macularius TaxID=481883 RepID=A0AA97JXU4_EUBMA|nr:calcium-independent phospholipase A2-gamma [Eublepharis macularius]XP_054844839.1 calcium-independent phospholipase A2-gamma [Eublepharis macularius]XP_054844840.1 calcium-independent phospholipase A2-gamma [Eublepharis macularius]
MTIQLPLNTCLYCVISSKSFWVQPRTQHLYYLCRPKLFGRIRYVIPLRVLHTGQPHCKWTRGKTLWYTKYLYCHGFLHCRIFKLSTSKELTNNRMSRFKNTLESVSKAVSVTHSELVSRIARLRPHSGILSKSTEENRQDNTFHVTVENDRQTTNIRSWEDCDDSLDIKKSVSVSGDLDLENISPGPLKERTDLKNSLFHVSYFATNFGETYNFLASHINWYFSTSVMDKEKKGSAFPPQPETQAGEAPDPPEEDILSNENRLNAASALIPSTQCPDPAKASTTSLASSKKSIANLLSYPSNSVQAFVDSYIGGLVPKLRADTKSALQEKTKEQEHEETLKDDEETKRAEEKEKRLSLQREKIIARVSIDNRTRALAQALRRSSNRRVYINRVEELTYHLLEFPESRGVAIKEKIIPCLLRLRQANDEALEAAVREALAVIGYTDPVKGWGIRILTIDGGGTRGLVALQTLRKLEELTGKPVHHLFDYICGVSTGAILAFMLGLFHIPLDECEELYRKLGTDVFKQNVIVGTVKMGWSHAFYDSESWEKMLKDRMGSDIMIETARNPRCPKVAAISTIVNRGTPLKAFVFRNYNHLPGVQSHYLGGCQYKLWQAIRASSAAPGYFQEYTLGDDLHQDGGLLLNNPTALAVHECKCLWPNMPLQCVISLGTGRYESDGKTNVTYTSLRAKLTNVISSATDTEEVHTMLDALLPPNTYFRFNPLMNEDIALDESRKEKLNQLRTDGIRYLERNEEKLKKAAKILTQEKTTLQRFNDWIRLKADMYEGLPFFSKL